MVSETKQGIEGIESDSKNSSHFGAERDRDVSLIVDTCVLMATAQLRGKPIGH